MPGHSVAGLVGVLSGWLGGGRGRRDQVMVGARFGGDVEVQGEGKFVGKECHRKGNGQGQSGARQVEPSKAKRVGEP